MLVALHESVVGMNERLGVVVEGWGLEDDDHGPEEAGGGEDEEEDSIPSPSPQTSSPRLSEARLFVSQPIFPQDTHHVQLVFSSGRDWI